MAYYGLRDRIEKYRHWKVPGMVALLAGACSSLVFYVIRRLLPNPPSVPLAIDKPLRADEFVPGDALSYVKRGKAFEGEGDESKALEDYATALTLLPSFAEALLARGKLLKRLGRYDDAFADFDAVVKTCPQHHAAVANRGLTQLSRRNYREAKEDIEEALRYKPEWTARFKDELAAIESKLKDG